MSTREEFQEWNSGIYNYEIPNKQDAIAFLYNKLKYHDLMAYGSLTEFKENIGVIDLHSIGRYEFFVFEQFKLVNHDGVIVEEMGKERKTFGEIRKERKEPHTVIYSDVPYDEKETLWSKLKSYFLYNKR